MGRHTESQTRLKCKNVSVTTLPWPRMPTQAFVLTPTRSQTEIALTIACERIASQCQRGEAGARDDVAHAMACTSLAQVIACVCVCMCDCLRARPGGGTTDLINSNWSHGNGDFWRTAGKRMSISFRLVCHRTIRSVDANASFSSEFFVVYAPSSVSFSRRRKCRSTPTRSRIPSLSAQLVRLIETRSRLQLSQPQNCLSTAGGEI